LTKHVRSVTGSYYFLKIYFQETSSAADDYKASHLFNKPWTLEVTNALTGRKTFSKEVEAPTFLLHTDGWEAGVYVVRALVGDESLAGKITVK